MALALWTDLSALGARGDNVTDDAAALQAAINAAPANGVWILPAATYMVGSPLVFGKICHLRAWGATIRYTGAAGPAAVTVGDPQGGRLYGGSMEGLQVVKAVQDWTTGLIGLQLKNVLEWEMRGFGASQFAVGVQVLGDGQGSAYNILRPRVIRDNGVGMQLTSANGGYVTEMSIEGGDWYYLAGGQAATHVQLPATASATPDNLRFVRCSFQAMDSGVTALDWQKGTNCAAERCRFETVNGSKMPVKFGPQTNGCSLVEPSPLQYQITDQGALNYSWVKGVKQ